MRPRDERRPSLAAFEQRPLPRSLTRCLNELPSRVRAEIDLHEFAQLDSRQRMAVERLAEDLRAHVVAYDLRATIRGRPLCTAARQAYLDADQLAWLQAVERTLPSRLALVAYARPGSAARFFLYGALSA
jgi:hypothetical protein